MNPARVRPSWASAARRRRRARRAGGAHVDSPSWRELAPDALLVVGHVDRVRCRVAVADAADPRGVARLDGDDPRRREERAGRDVRGLAVVGADRDVLELRRRLGERVGVGRDLGEVERRARDRPPRRARSRGRRRARARGRARPTRTPQLAGQAGVLQRGLVEALLDALHEEQQVQHLDVLLGGRCGGQPVGGSERGDGGECAPCGKGAGSQRAAAGDAGLGVPARDPGGVVLHDDSPAR